MKENYDIKKISDDCQFTGERFIPGQSNGEIELEHYHRYLVASDLVAGKNVLDIACGEGYGSSILAARASMVLGVDISPEAVSHANKRYKAENLKFILGTCSSIPLKNDTVDIVVSFETIEHHDEHDEMMSEIKRVLKPDGILLISCPDKLEYTDKPGYVNDYHVKELYRNEFVALLSKYFKRHEIYGQRVVYGSLILNDKKCDSIQSYKFENELQVSNYGVPNPVYLIAVASDFDIPPINCGILDKCIENSTRIKELSEHSERLSKSIEILKNNLSAVIVERDAFREATNNLENRFESLLFEKSDYSKEINELEMFNVTEDLVLLGEQVRRILAEKNEVIYKQYIEIKLIRDDLIRAEAQLDLLKELSNLPRSFVTVDAR